MLEVKKILLLGAGGHCISVLDSLLSSGDYHSIGIIDRKNSCNGDLCESTALRTVLGIPIIGDDEDLEQLFNEGYQYTFITIGSIGNVSARKNLYQRAKKIGFQIPNIVDKTSVVSPYASLGEGIYIGKNAVVNARAKIGNLSIINTSSVIEHECVLQDFVHVASGSVLSGEVQVGKYTHIGAGSVIKQGIHIGSKTMIGMGSVVVTNINDNVTAYGNPCKEVNYE